MTQISLVYMAGVYLALQCYSGHGAFYIVLAILCQLNSLHKELPNMVSILHSLTM